VCDRLSTHGGIPRCERHLRTVVYPGGDTCTRWYTQGVTVSHIGYTQGVTVSHLGYTRVVYVGILLWYQVVYVGILPMVPGWYMPPCTPPTLPGWYTPPCTPPTLYTPGYTTILPTTRVHSCYRCSNDGCAAKSPWAQRRRIPWVRGIP